MLNIQYSHGYNAARNKINSKGNWTEVHLDNQSMVQNKGLLLYLVGQIVNQWNIPGLGKVCVKTRRGMF